MPQTKGFDPKGCDPKGVVRRRAPGLSRRRVLWGAGGAAALALGGAALGGCATPFPEQAALRRWPPIGRFVTAKGLRLHYWDRGGARAGAPPVVLIHGASGNLRDWTHQIAPRLAAGRRVVAFDRPGLGYSERPASGGSDPRVQAAALAAAADALGLTRPILVGHSWGGAVAMAWALSRPDQVAGAVIVSGVTMPYTGAAKVFGAIGVDRLIVSLYSQYLKSSAEDGGVERFVRRAFRPQTPPPGYVEYVGGPLALRKETLAANAADLADLNDALLAMAPGYPSLRIPVEILHGTKDFIDPGRQAVPLSNTLAQARLTLLDGVGHMAHHAATDQLEAAIDRLSQSEQIDA